MWLRRSKEDFLLEFSLHFDQKAAASCLQVLEEFPETQINIDLKDQEERLIARVGEVLKTHGAENRLTTVVCFWS